MKKSILCERAVYLVILSGAKRNRRIYDRFFDYTLRVSLRMTVVGVWLSSCDETHLVRAAYETSPLRVIWKFLRQRMKLELYKPSPVEKVARSAG